MQYTLKHVCLLIVEHSPNNVRYRSYILVHLCFNEGRHRLSLLLQHSVTVQWLPVPIHCKTYLQSTSKSEFLFFFHNTQFYSLHPRNAPFPTVHHNHLIRRTLSCMFQEFLLGFSVCHCFNNTIFKVHKMWQCLLCVGIFCNDIMLSTRKSVSIFKIHISEDSQNTQWLSWLIFTLDKHCVLC
jgi:hypothetical protein